jgi:histone deacetylase 1/2
MMFRPFKATHEDIGVFHSNDYVEFLSIITHSTSKTLKKQFKINTDCPTFKGLFHFSQAPAGGFLSVIDQFRSVEVELINRN